MLYKGQEAGLRLKSVALALFVALCRLPTPPALLPASPHGALNG
tara:strand:- start:1587 stop:1718 length:132 start_codon:yes stop_codon:yes gene_type:complete